MIHLNLAGTKITMLFIFLLLSALSLAAPLGAGGDFGSQARKLMHTSRYAPLKRVNRSTQPDIPSAPSYNTVLRPTNQHSQYTIEVQFNNVPRYLLIDTGSGDTWMISSEFECLNAKGSTIPYSACLLGAAYTGPDIPQIGNESYYQVYGNNETVSGKFGFADVTVAGLTVDHRKVALVDRGYIVGDEVRSGVFGLAPQAITRLFENTNASTSPPNGTFTTYSTVFEGMYNPTNDNQTSIAPLFSLAMERSVGGGYIAFGGLPPIKFEHDFVFTPFQGINYFGHHDPGRYYAIQPQGFSLNGSRDATEYTAIIDSGTAVNRLPKDIADRVNAAL